MLGKPKFKFGDVVKFALGNEVIVGKIQVVDGYGTLFQNKEPSYDVYREENNTLYKHVEESLIEKV